MMFFVCWSRRESKGTHRPAQVLPLALALLLAACKPAPPAAATATPTPAPALSPAEGASLYEQSCAMCHYDGHDSQAAPALIGSPIVTGPPGPLIRVTLHGQRNVSVVNGRPFGGIMPATQGLTDAEVAAVVSYVRDRYGNGLPPVTAADVAKER